MSSFGAATVYEIFLPFDATDKSLGKLLLHVAAKLAERGDVPAERVLTATVQTTVMPDGELQISMLVVEGEGS